MPYFVLYCAIYLFILSLKAISLIGGKYLLKHKLKIERPNGSSILVFLLVVSYCFCNNMAKKARLYFRSLKVVLFYLYHLSQLHKIIIRPDIELFWIANKGQYILFHLLNVGSRKSLNKFLFE